MNAKITRSNAERRGPRQLTGRTVLFCLVAFFGVVSLVNAVMIHAAVSTFGGLETESSYKAGLAFAHEEAEAAAQAKRNWSVTALLTPASDGQVQIDITAFDGTGQPLTGHSAKALLAHPTDARLDHRIDLAGIGPGRYSARTAASAGQWELVIDLTRGNERLYRSRERIVLRESTPK